MKRNELTERERIVLGLREKYTLSETARILRVSIERIRSLETKARVIIARARGLS